jgi:hypothetical protein
MFQGRDDERDEVIDIDPLRASYLPGEELVETVKRGELTEQQANDELQGAARRHAAEHGPDLDTDEEGRITTGGFGSGQGMSKHSSGGRKARQRSGTA